MLEVNGIILIVIIRGVKNSQIEGNFVLGYIIGSLNTNYFIGLEDRNFSKIADIIQSEKFDVVALQEIPNQQFINNLINHRLPKWHGSYRRSGYGPGSHLGFGFLWNTRRLIECSGIEGVETHNIYGEMARNPCVGRFIPSEESHGPFVEIRLINVHLLYGDGAIYNTQRQNEFKMVTRKIYENISKDRSDSKNRAVYAFVLGDYNFSLIICQGIEAGFPPQTYYANTKIGEKTTLSDSKDEYISDFDHFGYNDERFIGTDVKTHRVDSVKKYLGNDFSLHRKEISNHVPIKLELNLNTRR